MKIMEPKEIYAIYLVYKDKRKTAIPLSIFENEHTAGKYHAYVRDNSPTFFSNKELLLPIINQLNDREKVNAEHGPWYCDKEYTILVFPCDKIESTSVLK